MKKTDLRAGDVILFPPHKGDFIAQAIAFLTDGEVNHAALCYPDGEILKVAESILKDGLVLDPFAEHIESKYPLRICRLRDILDVTPVLEAAKRYLDEKNAYPNFNLGLLGVLLVFKKFAPHTWKNKIVYEFCTWVAEKLMELVREKKYSGKHPMSCSQFVSQCFTDAGDKYDLQFDSLIVNFETKKQSFTHSLTVQNEVSLLDLLSQSEDLEICGTNLMENSFSTVKEDESQLVSDFIQVVTELNAIPLHMAKNVQTKSLEVGDVQNVSISKINKMTANLVLSLYELQQGSSATSIKEAISFLKSSTARNYFVSPQDLLVNCPKSLEYVGNLSY